MTVHSLSWCQVPAVRGGGAHQVSAGVPPDLQEAARFPSGRRGRDGGRGDGEALPDRKAEGTYVYHDTIYVCESEAIDFFAAGLWH